MCLLFNKVQVNEECLPSDENLERLLCNFVYQLTGCIIRALWIATDGTEQKRRWDEEEEETKLLPR